MGSNYDNLKDSTLLLYVHLSKELLSFLFKMNSSKSEISIDVPREEKNNVPHGGKKFDRYVLSPNMKCIASISYEDKSIVVWSITDELIVNYDSSLNVNDLEHALNTDKFCKTPDFNFKKIYPLLGISDCKQNEIKAKIDCARFRRRDKECCLSRK
ncbi:hypothetical protein C2G38_668177 [Gigaspora rosea]|uniref:Uncharacterized protein n=1 Tax=Gigaspora rosea TaxID=44941 RepID=A0A397U6A7_9GLOM|nr:hypothetical protein C2G38_668177 [Gigaspora rosea]